MQVQQADSVLVVGGGTTGVEMAAELKTAHPHKKVTFDLHACSDPSVSFGLHHSGFGWVACETPGWSRTRWLI